MHSPAHEADFPAGNSYPSPAESAQASVAASRLLVFADDWGRHPSSCQHLVKQLLPALPTRWVNTIGTRKPRLDLATLRRGLEKLRSWVVEEETPRLPLPTNLEVVSPRMWPYFTRAHDRKLNRWLLTRALAPALSTGGGPVTALTTLPLTADLVGALPVARWVYYCVDDFSQWPGLDQAMLEAMERELVAKVDTIVAASAVLQTRMQALGRDAQLLTHGVDLEHWQQQTEHEPLWPELPRPWKVFWGLIDRRLDYDWLAALAQHEPTGTTLLVGPTQDPDRRIEQLPRVALRPALAFDELPRLAQQADVLIMPYADLPVTRAMQPLKLLEYLATGKPVIVRDLPAVAPWRAALDACNDAESFAARVHERLLSGPITEQTHARARLAAESWSAKAQQLRGWL